MNTNDEQFWQELLAAFKVEADEHINTITSGLMELEKTTEPAQKKKIIETIFREAHSLKGAARAVNITSVEEICQALENVFAALKKDNNKFSSEFSNVLLQAVDVIGDLINEQDVPSEVIAKNINRLNLLLEEKKSESSDGAQDIEQSKPAKSEKSSVLSEPPMPGDNGNGKNGTSKLPEANAITEKVPAKEDVQPHKNGKLAKVKIERAKKKNKKDDTIRISSQKLDALFLQTQEMISAKLAQGQLLDDLKEITQSVIQWEKKWSRMNKELQSLRQFGKNSNFANGECSYENYIKYVSDFLLWDYNQLKAYREKMSKLLAQALDNYWCFDELMGNLMDEMKKVLMLPFSTILSAFPKMVRDLAHERQKEVELTIKGGEIEIDKRVLEAIKDPLIHLVRNSIDHGLEKTRVRRQRGKDPKGQITIAISQMNSNRVEILIADDGAGIDTEKVKRSAIKKGFITQAEAASLDDKQAVLLIFESEVSTSPIITDISGRGLGMAIVREKVERLGGSIAVETEMGKGTTFRIFLPLTLATFRGILVRVCDQLFVVPTSGVDQIVRLNKDNVKTVENAETISIDDQAISLVFLGDLLKLNQACDQQDDDYLKVMLLGTGENRIAIYVDEIIGEQEILIKSLGKNLARVPNVAGATVLGNGRVVPVLNVADILKAATKTVTFSPVAKRSPEQEEEKKSILIAEDSITSRMLVKNILESAGYDVKTAVDGAEAWKTLKAKDFDLVVSDVEMPHMNGFDLTKKIRADKKLMDLPVVLVTSLGSKEDQERGIDAGANAYIVKSNFEQNSLLKVIRQLI